jgi:hypothetical protein
LGIISRESEKEAKNFYDSYPTKFFFLEIGFSPIKTPKSSRKSIKNFFSEITKSELYIYFVHRKKLRIRKKHIVSSYLFKNKDFFQILKTDFDSNYLAKFVKQLFSTTHLDASVSVKNTFL